MFHLKSPKIFPGSYVFISVFTHLFLIYFLSALILSVYFIDYCVFLYYLDRHMFCISHSEEEGICTLKWYLCLLLFNVYNGMRLLDTLGVLSVQPDIRVLSGVILLSAALTMMLTDKLLHNHVDFKAMPLKVLFGTGVFLMIAEFIIHVSS